MKRQPSKTWHVYLLRCADGTLYCGMTNDLPRRIANHNSGAGAKYTRSRKPVELVWSQRCRSKPAALKKEYAIKQLSRAGKERLCGQSSRSGSSGRKIAGF